MAVVTRARCPGPRRADRTRLADQHPADLVGPLAGRWALVALPARRHRAGYVVGARDKSAGCWGLLGSKSGPPGSRRAPSPPPDARSRGKVHRGVNGADRGFGRPREGPFTWSVTPFFNELDLLEARLTEMARMVDRFVVIEARQTFRGAPKPLYFQENSHLFRRWSAQIDHVVVDLPEGPDAWAHERHQRNVAHKILADLGAAQDDLVLLTDLDEVVRADRIDAAREATVNSPVILMMTQYWYSLDWRQEDPWLHPKAFRYGQVPGGTTFHDVRHTLFPVLVNSGWHLSWFGDEDRFNYKLASFSHSEFDTPERRERGFSDGLIEGGVDIHGRKLLLSGDHFPASLAKIFKAGR